MSYFNNFQPYDHMAFAPTFPHYYHGEPYGQEVFAREMAMLNQGMVHGHGGKTTETKPRLSKDEVDRLENEFQKNNKPTSSLKKTLAESMGVDVSRINNWFQNRRAKAKHEKREQAKEAQQKSEQVAEPTTGNSDTVKEYYASNDQDEDLRPSFAPFPPAKATTSETRSARESPSAEEAETTSTPNDASQKPCENVSEDASPASIRLQHDEADMNFFPSADAFFSTQPSCDYSSLTPEANNQAPCLTLSIPNHYVPQLVESNNTSSLSPFHHFSGSAHVDDCIASHLFPHGFAEPIAVDMKQDHARLDDASNALDQFSPESMSRSPPEIHTPDFPFRSPSTVDIASRRNIKRPAQLLSTRSQSYNLSGPKSGVELSRRTEAVSPMRRVTSATGHFPRGIQKASSAGPRSPMYLDRNQESMILQLASHAPSRGSVAPPTPNTPVVPTQQNIRETTVSSMSSDEDKMFNMQANLMVPHYPMDPTMRTPPDTPGLMTNMSSSLLGGFDYNIPDEPLATPSFGGFEQCDLSLMSASVPSYVTQGCASQPVTPGFASGNMGPAFFSSYGGGNTEYNWSDASPASTRPSPEQSKARQFQFTTNMTPQDFHAE
ncbi:Homeobox-leucine zipper protein HAT1 [Colletotrichum trifolii]|uniref:Homeobox-leucine zipper protein HAT1 n=1 Tax=Colletotrichum trifolii TaxID=5466 RepID=A0A4R8RI43_COLTR|nr:Homeobox-leucine zipper protein HAT1 [Colletotrichum trifolii]